MSRFSRRKTNELAFLFAVEAGSDDARKAAEGARKLASAEQDLRSLRQEREEVRIRIARLMEVLDGLE